jgi:hypothetical protein
VTIRQELELARLRARLAEETLARTRCQDNRRREGHFLEAVIAQCKGDNVPLTDTSCTDFCRMNQVNLPVCKAVCQTKIPSCSYWHKDTIKPPLVTFEEVTNRSRRAGQEEWLGRLRAYRELRGERDTGEAEREEEDWGTEGAGDQTVQVIQLSNETECHRLSCVSHLGLATIACLDFQLVDRPAGFFRLQSGWRGSRLRTSDWPN